MSKKALQLGFCLAVLVAATLFTAPAAQAIDLSYTQPGVGATMAQACNNAIQKIKNNCDKYGTITTDPGACWPLWDINGNLLGYACTCEATSSYCLKYITPPFNPPF